MFMSLMTPERIAQLGELTATELRIHAKNWALMERVVLYDTLQEVLTGLSAPGAAFRLMSRTWPGGREI
jgi:hypothetical protein